MKNNCAFIDCQNLRLATVTASIPWKIDMKRFRVYLAEKYNVEHAYCFLGAQNAAKYKDMYDAFKSYGYDLIFREHSKTLKGKKKGNVDVDIVFEIMRQILKNEDFEKIILVSGDGDYKRLVDYLIKIERFEKILLPNQKYASTLYKQLSDKCWTYLDTPDSRKRFGRIK